MLKGPTIQIGLVVEIADYEVLFVGDSVTVAYRDAERAGELVTTQEVKHLARFVRRARELRVALAQFPDFEVVYLFDLAQDGYGYALNIQAPRFSEWGTLMNTSVPGRLTTTSSGMNGRAGRSARAASTGGPPSPRLPRQPPRPFRSHQFSPMWQDVDREGGVRLHCRRSPQSGNGTMLATVPQDPMGLL